jgi:hypothetical protein
MSRLYADLLAGNRQNALRVGVRNQTMFQFCRQFMDQRRLRLEQPSQFREFRLAHGLAIQQLPASGIVRAASVNVHRSFHLQFRFRSKRVEQEPVVP